MTHISLAIFKSQNNNKRPQKKLRIHGQPDQVGWQAAHARTTRHWSSLAGATQNFLVDCGDPPGGRTLAAAGRKLNGSGVASGELRLCPRAHSPSCQ